MPAVFESPKLQSLADLQHHLGDVPAWRIRLWPAPGSATEQDVKAIHAKEKRLFELVDGVLLEKAMGFKASWLAGVIFSRLLEFVEPRNLGLLAGADGMLKLSSGLVRIPDVSFIAWDRIPEGKVPEKPVPRLAPNLAVEVLSEGNTPAEMKRKLREYFKAKVLLVWIFDPEARTVAVYTSVRKPTLLTEDDTLSGGAVLPGLELSLRELFAVLDQKAPK